VHVVGEDPVGFSQGRDVGVEAAPEAPVAAPWTRIRGEAPREGLGTFLETLDVEKLAPERRAGTVLRATWPVTEPLRKQVPSEVAGESVIQGPSPICR
jgi:hypothetical protein